MRYPNISSARKDGEIDMNQLQRKLRSQKGASITIALLIFLVCAVVGVSVLVAGTASAGRMASAAKADQRFYAVSSAGEQLIGMIEGEQVQVIIKKTTETDISSGEKTTTKELTLKKRLVDNTGTNTDGEGGSASYTVVESFNEVQLDENGKLSSPAFDSYNTEEAYRHIVEEKNAPATRTIKLEVSGYPELTCYLEQTWRPEGRMVFQVYNANIKADGTEGSPGDAYEKYMLMLTFDEVKTGEALETSTVMSDDSSKEIETETRTTDLKWQLTDINTFTTRAAIPGASTPSGE